MRKIEFSSFVTLATVLVVGSLLFNNGIVLAQGTPSFVGFSGGGSGTVEDPYQITTCEQLQEIGQLDSDNEAIFNAFIEENELWDEYDYYRQMYASFFLFSSSSYILNNDLDCSDTTNWNGGAGFEPITFSGNFDGQGYTISNLFINRPDARDIGLFGTVNGGTISNVGLINVNIAGMERVGGLVGSNNAGTIIDSYSGGVVAGIGSVLGGAGEIGGLVGYNNGGNITNSYTVGTVSASEQNSIGGLVGRNRSTYPADTTGIILNSYSDAGVLGGYWAGGLIGLNEGGFISNSYATGGVAVNLYTAGGLIGNSIGGEISDSYATGDVLAPNGGGVGGLIGTNTSAISGSYATGIVTGGGLNVGGLIGYNEGNITSSYATGAVNTTSGDAGGLVGKNIRGASIDNSYATGNITAGASRVGGLVGYNDGESSVTNSYATGSVNATEQVGGLVGHNSGHISNSYATGDVAGAGINPWDGNYVGGLVGYNSGTNADVSGSYATGSATGNDMIGGLIGSNTDSSDGPAGEISNSYAWGAVSGDDRVGGLIGENRGSVTNTYAVGLVTGNTLVGGLVGNNSGAVTNSFYDSQTSGQSDDDGRGEPKTTLEMQTVTTFSDVGWPVIVSDEATTVGYPFFPWQVGSGETGFLIPPPPTAITITPDAGQTKVYGEADPTFTYTFEPALNEGESFTGALGRTVNEDVGSYDYNLGDLSAGPFYLLQINPEIFTITQRPITVTAQPDTKEYDGTAVSTTVPVVGGGLASWDVSDFSQIFANGNVGTNKLLVVSGTVLDSDGNSASANYIVTFVNNSGGVITQRSLTVSGLAAENKIYDSTTSATITGTPVLENTVAGDDVSVVGAPVGEFDTVDVGANTVTISGLSLTGTDAGNYELVEPITVIADITPLPITVTPDAGQTKVYGEDDPTFGYASDPLLGGDVLSGDLDRFLNENVGSFPYNPGTLSAGSNYSLVLDGSNTFSITPRPITVTAVTDIKEYDDTVLSMLSPVITAGNLVFSDTPSFSQSFDTSSVGTDKTLTPTGFVLDGNSGANYTVTFVSVIGGEITPATLTIAGLTAETRVYDGATVMTITGSPSLVGVIVGDDVSAVGTPVGEASSANVGINEITITGLSLTGADVGNYVLADPIILLGEITPLSVTITPNAGQTKVYGDTDPSFTFDDSIDPDNGYTGSLSRVASENVGDYDFEPGDLSAGPNYSLVLAAGNTFSITPRLITVTAFTDTKEYDGAVTSIAIPTITTGDLAFSDTPDFSQVFADPAVGTGKTLTPSGIVTDGNGGANYSVSFAVDTTGVITPRPLTVSGLTADTKVYDSTTVATFTGAPVLENTVTGDDVAVTGTPVGTFDAANVGTNVVAVTGLSLTGTTAGNYTLTQPTLSADITPLPITITPDAGQTKVYGDADPTFGYASDPLLGGDVLTGDLGREVGENANSYDYETGSLSGGDNYSLVLVAGNTFDITPRPITATASTDAKEYDGTAASAAVPTITTGDLAFSDTTDFSQVFADAVVGTGKTITPSGVVLDGNGGLNYIVTFVEVTDGEITTRPVTVTGLTVEDRAYDGTTDATLVGTPILDNAVVGDDISLTDTAVGTFATSTVGTTTVDVTGLSLVGVDAGNYVLDTPITLTAGITARPVTVAGLSASNKTHDGTTAATITGTPALQNAIAGDDVSLRGIPTGTFDSPDVGLRTVTVSGLSLDGADASNYTLTSTPLTAQINSRGGGGGGGGGGGPYTFTTPATKVGDANKDGRVDILDFNILMVNWGLATINNPADFNQDGKIDLLDFNTLMVYWIA